MYDPTLSDISSGDERSPGVSREGSRTNLDYPESSRRYTIQYTIYNFALSYMYMYLYMYTYMYMHVYITVHAHSVLYNTFWADLCHPILFTVAFMTTPAW